MVITGLLITINLPGELGGFTKHVNKQKNTIFLTDGSDPKRLKTVRVTREILHTDREMSDCVQVVKVSEESVRSWVFGECPSWERKGKWAIMSDFKRMISYVNRFDEGFGVSFKQL